MTIPGYVQGYPPDGSSLGNTKTQIRSNLDGTFLTVAVNHFDNNSAHAGQHQFVEMPNSAVAPTVPSGATSCALYNGGSSFGPGTNDLFYLPPGSASLASGVQLTRNELPINAVNGYSWLPGGVLIQWGEVTATNGNPNVTFPIAFPSALYNIQVTRQRAPASPGSTYSFWVSTTGLSTTGFTIINNDGHSWSYNWFAIGK